MDVQSTSASSPNRAPPDNEVLSPATGDNKSGGWAAGCRRGADVPPEDVEALGSPISYLFATVIYIYVILTYGGASAINTRRAGDGGSHDCHLRGL